MSLSEPWVAGLSQEEIPEPSPGAPALEAEPAARRAALAALYRTHARAIHRFLCDLLGDAAAAADATQETFVRALRRLHTLEDPARPAPWLFGIARHVSLEHRRALRRRRRVMHEAPLDPAEGGEPEADAGSPEETLLGHEALGVVRGAMAQLSEDRRAALLLRLDHGLSCEEIARTMEWSVAKVKVEIHRARQVLRAELLRYEGSGEEGGARW